MIISFSPQKYFRLVNDRILLSGQRKSEWYPADENILTAQVRKRTRYEQLSIDMKEVNNWNSKIITVEVGARGFVAKSMNSCLLQIGFTAHSASSICKKISLVVARCSYHIWVCRYNKKWQWKPLLETFTPTDTVGDIKEHT